jgi:hypothetical protein
MNSRCILHDVRDVEETGPQIIELVEPELINDTSTSCYWW